jgi:alkylation response protein AidB-like acyl-CoA dehydrogenase
MDFSLSETHEAIRQVAREFAQKKLIPRAAEFDETGKMDFALAREMGESGFMGIVVPEEYGGTGLDTLAYVIVLEELGHGCASHCTMVGAHNSLFAHPILKFGTEAQKHFYLPPVAAGEKFAAFSLSEPAAGGIRCGRDRIGGGPRWRRLCPERHEDLRHQRRVRRFHHYHGQDRP